MKNFLMKSLLLLLLVLIIAIGCCCDENPVKESDSNASPKY